MELEFWRLNERLLNLYIGFLRWLSETHSTGMVLVGVEVGALLTLPVHFEFLCDLCLFFLLLHDLLLQLQYYFKSLIYACILTGYEGLF